MAKKKKKKDYFGLGKTTSLILVIIPITAWICGAIVRFQEGKFLAGLIRLFLGFNIVYIVDLICMILKGKIWRLL